MVENISIDDMLQIIVDSKQICKHCLATQMECERIILDTNSRCCDNCWHCYIDSVELEDKLHKLKEKKL